MMVKDKGIGILPLVRIDDVTFSTKQYPRYAELKQALDA
jgi:hypothetical protein